MTKDNGVAGRAQNLDPQRDWQRSQNHSCAAPFEHDEVYVTGCVRRIPLRYAVHYALTPLTLLEMQLHGHRNRSCPLPAQSILEVARAHRVSQGASIWSLWSNRSG
jgi:hypothetical protein